MVVKGKRLTQKEHWQKLLKELEGMNRKQKWEHLWEYYKWVLFVAIVIIVIICVIVSSIISLNTETIIAGAVVNLQVSDGGLDYLKDGYYERTKTGGRQAVGLTYYNFIDPMSSTDQTYGLKVYDNVIGAAGGGGLDYVIFDDEARTYFLDPYIFSDLRDLFSDEELAAMGSAVIKVKSEGKSEPIPLAINIRDTQFFADYVLNENEVYICFILKTDKKGSNEKRCRDFWEYLKGGKTKLLQTRLAGTTVDLDLNEKGKELLSKGMFSKMKLSVGDERVELTHQSFLWSEDGQTEAVAKLVKADVCDALEVGRLDYILCDQAAWEALPQTALLELGQLLSEEELAKLGSAVIRSEDGTPVALELSGASFGKTYAGSEKRVYLAFSAKTERLEACRALLGQILSKEK